MVRDAGGTMDTMCPVDLTEMKGCERLVNFALERMGGFDVLFNKAAMAYFGWMEDYSEEDFWRTFTEATTSVFLLCKAAWTHMVERKNFSIVNIDDGSAHQTNMAVTGIAHNAAQGKVWSMKRHKHGRADVSNTDT